MSHIIEWHEVHLIEIISVDSHSDELVVKQMEAL